MSNEPEALRQYRVRLLEQIGKASDEILRIDSRLRYLLEGRTPGAGAA